MSDTLQLHQIWPVKNDWIKTRLFLMNLLTSNLHRLTEERAYLVGGTDNLTLANTMKVAADCQHRPRKLKTKKGVIRELHLGHTRTLQGKCHGGGGKQNPQ